MEREDLDHQEASLLLPWLGTDRLEQGELELLLDHLKSCRVCRGELRDLADLGRFAELSERAEAPDGQGIERRLAGVLARLEEPGRQTAESARQPRRPARVRPWILPLAALVLVAFGMVTYFSPAPRQPALYQTLSSPEPARAEGAALRAVFADGCTQGELRGVLQGAAAEIRSGPTQHGVYTLVLMKVGAEAESVEARIEALRREPCFVFVEKVADAGNRS